MRIAFFIDQFPSLSETFILNQITGLIDRGHEVDIYCDRPGNRTQMHPEVNQYQLLQRVYHTPVPGKIILRCLKGIFLFLSSFLAAPAIALKSLNFLKYNRASYGDVGTFLRPLYLAAPLIKQPSYDIIHCHYGRNGLKAILLKDLGAIDAKIVVTFHGYDISRYLQIHGEDVYNYLFQRADLLQPISKYWYKKLIALGCQPDRICLDVHHMGIDCDRFAPVENKNFESSEINIVGIARLVEKKGLRYGIEAVARLLSKHPDLDLSYQIIGDGMLREELETQIERLGIGDRVKLLGWKQQQEVKAIISQADIVLAPSVTSKEGDCEGIPVSLMEAMAQAIPIVSTYHSGIPELVEDGVTGYLVAERDVVTLTQKLECLAQDSNLRQQMGWAGRQKVIEEFNIELLCDRLVNIYQRLLIDYSPP
ncbi:MAG: glycosyltransferase [Cyanobacteria bacterium P01_G01_bin.19]